jgi:DNA-binding NarL/FixJ family response regulator
MDAEEIVCGTDQILEKAQEGQMVQSALAELPLLRRRLIELAFFQQHSHQEIAKELRMPTGTVKSYMRRALRKLGVRSPRACDAARDRRDARRRSTSIKVSVDRYRLGAISAILCIQVPFCCV